MCSGFFTGSTDYMQRFCDAIEGKFMEALEAGYGHADEQLFSMVYFDNRDIFDVYYGDYQEMVTNYVYPVDSPVRPVRQLIANAAKAGDYVVAEKGCETVWEGWKRGVVPMDDVLLRDFVRSFRNVREKLGKGAGLP